LFETIPTLKELYQDCHMDLAKIEFNDFGAYLPRPTLGGCLRYRDMNMLKGVVGPYLSLM
jgi:hypothetical protein